MRVRVRLHRPIVSWRRRRGKHSGASSSFAQTFDEAIREVLRNDCQGFASEVDEEFIVTFPTLRPNLQFLCTVPQDQFTGAEGVPSAVGPSIGALTASADTERYRRVRRRLESNAGTFDVDSYGGLVYGSLLPVPNLFVDLVGGYSYKTYATKRQAAAQRALTIEIDDEPVTRT